MIQADGFPPACTTAREKYSVTPAKTDSVTPAKTDSVTPAKAYSVIPAKAYSVIPAKAYSVIPAKAGIHNSRASGNSSSFPRRRESTIPAHAGIHRPITPTPEKTLRHSREGLLRHSREGGNPQFPRTREFIVPLPQLRHSPTDSVIPAKPTPSFPRRRESTIPAHAGIPSHYPNARKNTPSFPRGLLCHSRDSVIPAKTYSVIPAKAGIHNSRACGNSSSHYPNARENTPSFPPSRE